MAIILWPPPWSRSSLAGRIAGVVWVVTVAPVVIVVSVLVAISLPFQSFAARRAGPRMSRRDVAATIQAFLEGTGGRWDWDNFVSVPIGDQYLDEIRLRCAALDEEFPPVRTGDYCSEDGIAVLRQFVSQLRKPEQNDSDA